MVEIPTSNRPPPATGGRLMILNTGRLGDTILRNSILDSALRTFATVDYICGRHNTELLRHTPGLNRVIVLDNSAAGFANLLKAALGHRYDAFIDLKGHRSSTSLIMAALFHGRVRTGCNRGLLRPFHRDVSKVIVPGLHVVESTRRIGQMAGLAQGEYKPTLFLPPDSIEWFRRNYAALARPFIFLNISGRSIRVWPLKNWVRYVHGCGLADKPILISGLPKDREHVQQLCKELPGTVPFQPRGFMDVVAAINDAGLVLTVETGVVHVCSALDKPVVALYSQTKSLISFKPLSTWQLVIHPQSGAVPDINPEEAIGKSLSHGFPPPF
jgi:ADP-heptose:LPS heptosyltransferase